MHQLTFQSTCPLLLHCQRRPRVHKRQVCVQVLARNLILFSKREAAKSGIALSNRDRRAQHIRDHLKSQPGDTVKVGVVNGLKGLALVKEASNDGVQLAWSTWHNPDPPPPITLLLAMPRPKALRRLWRDLAQIGVQSVVITRTETVPAGYQTSSTLRPDAIVRELLPGLEQAGDTILPRVAFAPSLAAAIELVAGSWQVQGESSVDREEQAWESSRELLHGPHLASKSKAAATNAAPRVAPGVSRAASIPASAPDSSEKLAFLTQCLQVRRELEDQRWHSSKRLYNGFGSAQQRVVAAPTFDVEAPLTLACHPAETTHLFDRVRQYKRQMNAHACHVWHSEEIERRAAPHATGGAGDRYYGEPSSGLDTDSNAGLVDTLVEAFNVDSSGGNMDMSRVGGVACATGTEASGTTNLDSSSWGRGRVVLAVGPERGWTELELKMLGAAGYEGVGFGTRTLTSSLATISAVSVCQEALRS